MAFPNAVITVELLFCTSFSSDFDILILTSTIPFSSASFAYLSATYFQEHLNALGHGPVASRDRITVQ